MANGICDYLQVKIKEFLARRNESLRWLCRLTGVSYSTLYRLQAGDQNKLAFNTAYKILKVIEPENFLTILGDYFPVESRDLSPPSEVKTDEKLALAERLADDPPLYKVYLFAATPEGSNRESIKDRFGYEGLQCLDELIRMGVLEESETGFIDRFDGIIYPSERSVKKVCVYHIHLVSLETPGSHIQNYRNAVSPQGVVELHQAASEFQEKLVTIAKEHPGEIVVVAAAIVGPASSSKGI